MIYKLLKYICEETLIDKFIITNDKSSIISKSTPNINGLIWFNMGWNEQEFNDVFIKNKHYIINSIDSSINNPNYNSEEKEICQFLKDILCI